MKHLQIPIAIFSVCAVLCMLPQGRAAQPSKNNHAASGVVAAACPADAQALGAATCGYVPVPLDRSHPNLGTINIYFERYSHTGSGPAVSAILVNFGGPGDGTTIQRNV